MPHHEVKLLDQMIVQSSHSLPPVFTNSCCKLVTDQCSIFSGSYQ